MGVHVDDQTRPTSHNFKKSKLIKRTNIESLPEDVVFDILARVPAHDIYNAARLVCRKWYQTTRTRDFVCAQHQQSTCGLLIQHIFSSDQSKKPLSFATQKGRIIEISDFDCKFKGYALSSCNGLMLGRYFKKPNGEFRITNLATKKHLDLPSIGPDMEKHSYISMAYAVASNKYKVVRSFFNWNSGEQECAILTVGVDEDWKRRVDIQHLSPTAKKNLTTQRPLTTQGFVHWATQPGTSPYSDYVLTLNVETEIITQFQAVPPSLLCGCDGETKLLYHYLPMGSYLSLLIARDSESIPIWDQVWAMKPETGEWTKTMSICSESLKGALQGVSAPFNLRPVGWLKFREVLVFGSCSWSRCIAYNVRTHKSEPFELGFVPLGFNDHRNSLVWLDGC